jgi:hypothetical protein
MNVRRSVLCTVAAVCTFFPLSAEYNRFGSPDSSELRRTIVDTWFLAPLELIRENQTMVQKNSIGQEFQVRLEEQGSTFAVIVAPGMMLDVNLYTAEGVGQQRVASYPADACGSWVLTRDSVSGKPISVRYYYAQDSDVYVQFTPDGMKTLADMVISGSYAARSVPVGISFDRLYTASLAAVLQLTDKTLPWRYADIHPDSYHSSMQMVSVIRKNLSRITCTDDAAYDEDGKPVRISDGKPRAVSDAERDAASLSLSSAGFIKWIVDGLVEPLSGSNTLLAPLTQRTVEYKPQGYTGIRSETDDISFTLDWTRNLASAWLSVRTGKTYLAANAGVDVKIEPFSARVSDKGIIQTTGYLKDTGYAVENLRPLLYVLAVTEPSYCYLAAVRRLDPGVPQSHPEAYVFDQIAIFFPYFDTNGRFGCFVFENGTEIPYSVFVSKYKKSFIHLTRLLTTDRFFPQ